LEKSKTLLDAGAATGWERAFVGGVESYAQKHGAGTDAQIETLKQVIGKLEDRSFRAKMAADPRFAGWAAGSQK